MQLCRFIHHTFDSPRYGLLEGEAVFTLDASDLASAPTARRIGQPLSLDELQLVAPVTPSKIVCVGRNYLEHAAELGNKLPDQPLLFLKAPSAIIGPGEAIVLPPESERVEHEGELGVVIGRRARRLSSADDPLAYVLGYTCVNDVTARDLQRREVQFTRAKSFDTFCPVGPVIVSDINPADVEVTTRVNDVTKQRARTSAMAFSVPMLLRYISHAMTLLPGDLIATGTPAGVSKLSTDDIVSVEVEGIGVLSNTVTSLES